MKTIKEKIFEEVLDGYFTKENFLREDKSAVVKRTIDTTINYVKKLIDERLKKHNKDIKCCNTRSNLWWRRANIIAELEELKSKIDGKCKQE